MHLKEAAAYRNAAKHRYQNSVVLALEASYCATALPSYREEESDPQSSALNVGQDYQTFQFPIIK